MKLSKKHITKIYNYWKDKKLNLDDMLKMYGIDTSDYVLYELYIEFKRGRDYEDTGLLTQKEFRYVKEMLEKGITVPLGEVNGKHSNVRAYAEDYTFYDGNDEEDKEKVENYILQNGSKSTFTEEFEYKWNEYECEREGFIKFDEWKEK